MEGDARRDADHDINLLHAAASALTFYTHDLARSIRIQMSLFIYYSNIQMEMLIRRNEYANSVNYYTEFRRVAVSNINKAPYQIIYRLSRIN